MKQTLPPNYYFLKKISFCLLAALILSNCQKESASFLILKDGTISEIISDKLAVDNREQGGHLPKCSEALQHEIRRLQQLADENCAPQTTYFHCEDAAGHPLCYFLFAEPTAGNCPQTALLSMVNS